MTDEVMEKEENLIKSWIFQYLSHESMRFYFEHPNPATLFDNEEFQRNFSWCVKQSKLVKSSENSMRLLFFNFVTMEQSQDLNMVFQEDKDLAQNLAQHIAFSSQGLTEAPQREMARDCLINTHMVYYKSCLRNDDDLEAALNLFANLVTIMGTDDCKDAYQQCTKMTEISEDDNFMLEYLESLKQLVKAFCAKISDPDLFKLAEKEMHLTRKQSPGMRKHQSSVEDKENSIDDWDMAENMIVDVDFDIGNHTELKTLLRDQRPSKMSDLEELMVEEDNSMRVMRARFQSYDGAARWNALDIVERRDTKAPSHRSFRCGSWMPEEERELVLATLRIGVGKWAEIKQATKSLRSSQQLKDKWRSIKTSYVDRIKEENRG